MEKNLEKIVEVNNRMIQTGAKKYQIARELGFAGESNCDASSLLNKKLKKAKKNGLEVVWSYNKPVAVERETIFKENGLEYFDNIVVDPVVRQRLNLTKDVNDIVSVGVIGDAHVKVGDTELYRFRLAGKHQLANKPDYIVIGGDFMSMECVSAWDKSKRKLMEGRRYKSEMEYGNKALDELMKPINDYNKQQRKNKGKQYKPTIIYLEGNHCDRLNRYLEYDPTFQDFINIPKDLNLEGRGIQWVPYREYYFIGKTGFTHIPFNSMKPISGSGLTVSVAKKCLQYCDFDVVFFHTHRFEIAHSTGASGERRMAVNGGCLLHSEGEDYAKGCTSDWWRGLVDFKIVDGKMASVQATEISLLESMYG